MGNEALTSREARDHAREWLSNRLKKPPQGKRSQFNELMKQLGDLCVAEALRSGDDESGLDQRLDAAHDILWYTWYALAPQEAKQFNWEEEDKKADDEQRELYQTTEIRQHIIWYRRDPEQVFIKGFTAEDHVEADRNALWEQIGEYLKRRWLRHAALDWIFVDAMIFNEICAFGESIKRDLLPGKKDLFGMHGAYFEAKGKIEDIGRMNLKHSLESLWNKALWLLIIPIGGVYALAHYGYSGTAGIIGFFYSFVFVSYAGFKTARWIYRKVTGWKHQAIKATELWQKMAAVYRLTEGPVINPTMLKEELLKTRDAGAAWDIALYSMVDRIIAIDPSAWVVSWRN